MALEDGFVEISGKKYQIVTIDFETYYDKDYTLSGKINTSEYIRDDRFHAHGVGIKIGNGKTLWYTGKNIPLALREIDWARSALLAHNTAFDGFICSHVYGIRPAVYLDTLSMARAAHGHHMRHDLDTVAKAHGLAGKVKRDALADTKGKQQLTDKEERALGAYCVDDVEDTYKIFWKLFDYIPDNELQLIDMTQKMFSDPVLRIDIPRVQAELEKEIGGKAAALLRSGASVEDLMSNEKFACLLQAAGAQLPQKISPSTGKLTYAFAKSDLAFQDLMKNGNDKVRALCEARLKVKSTIGETRAARFLEAGKNGMRLPILLNYSGAHTHRWSGANKMNLQNLKRGGELRRSILAPKGHVIVVADSAQIEARVLAWLAGQTDIVNAFANKEDVYKLMASAIYGVPVDQVTKDQRFIGKVCTLGLGYGLGHMKLQQTLKQGVMGPPVDISIEECKRIVNIYRSRNYKIRQLWKIMDDIIASMLTGTYGEYGPLTYGKGYIQLPSGLFLQYYGLHGEAEVRYDDLVVHEATYLTRQGRSKIYGGLLTENCIAKNTQVLTDVGWVAIEDITPHMLVHDGVEFVRHGGVLHKGVQACVTVDGVHMTPEHEVLTNDGWQAASQNPEPYRPDIRLPDSIVCSARSEGETPMGVSLRVWDAKECGRYGVEKRDNQKLRVPDQGHAVKSTNYTRHVEAPRIRSMAIDGRPLQTTYTPCLEKLRRARDYCLQTMATVRGLLGGYGGLLPARVNTGPGRQQLRILQTELPLGAGPGTGHEPAQLRPCRRYTGTQRGNRDTTVNSVLPHSPLVADRTVDARAKPAKPVFDILNCGPRQRFVVLGDSGAFIVHNCVQALARCIIADQMLEISKKYRICTMSHDEIIVVAPKKDADRCLRDMIRIMSTPPDWADGLPLAAEGGWSVNYSK